MLKRLASLKEMQEIYQGQDAQCIELQDAFLLKLSDAECPTLPLLLPKWVLEMPNGEIRDAFDHDYYFDPYIKRCPCHPISARRMYRCRADQAILPSVANRKCHVQCYFGELQTINDGGMELEVFRIADEPKQGNQVLAIYSAPIPFEEYSSRVDECIRDDVWDNGNCYSEIYAANEAWALVQQSCQRVYELDKEHSGAKVR